MKYILLSLRPHQWIKNLFIFLPLIFGKILYIYPCNINVLFAFILFCAISSVAYLLNDLYDLEKDKAHPIKSKRPIASGKVGVRLATFFIAVLGCASIGLSFMLNFKFGIVGIVYLVFNILYTRIFKNMVIIDVFAISVFYLLRILAGSVVAGVYLSYWIIIMVMLLSLFLGFNKRRQEIQLLSKHTLHSRPVLAKYSTYFIDQMVLVTTSSIIVVYIFYAIDPVTIHLFGNRHLLYTVPFVYYGIFRYLYLLQGNPRDEDPTRILLADKPMQLNLLFWLIVSILVVYFKF